MGGLLQGMATGIFFDEGSVRSADEARTRIDDRVGFLNRRHHRSSYVGHVLSPVLKSGHHRPDNAGHSKVVKSNIVEQGAIQDMMQVDNSKGISAVFYITNFPDHLLYVDLKKGLEVCGILEDVYVSRFRNSKNQRFGFVKFQKVRDELKLQKALNNVIFWDLRLYANVAKFDRFVREERVGGSVGGSGVGGGEGEKNNIKREKKILRVAVDVVRVRKVELEKVKEEAVRSEEERERARTGEGGSVKEGVEQVREMPVLKDGEEVIEKPAEEEVVSDTVLHYLPLYEDTRWATNCRVARIRNGCCVSVVQQSLADAGLEGIRLIPLGGDNVLISPSLDIQGGDIFQSAASIFDNFLAWNMIFFAELAETQGRLLQVDECTVNKERMDFARILVATSFKEVSVTIPVVNRRMTSWLMLLLNIFMKIGFRSRRRKIQLLVQRVGFQYTLILVRPSGHIWFQKQTDTREFQVVPDNRHDDGSKRSSQTKRRLVVPSVKNLKRIGRLSEEDRKALIRSLKKSKCQKTGSKASSRSKQGTSLSIGSGNSNKSVGSEDWKNWVALHGDEKTVEEDINNLGGSIGVNCSNSFQILSFNVRGLGTVEKRRELRKVVVERRVDILCIQESKLQVVEASLIHSIWGTQDVNFSYKLSVGASGGIITMWDPRSVLVWSTVQVSGCLIIMGKFMTEDVDFCIANVYAPCDPQGRVSLWNVLSSNIQFYPQAAWCILGDFNAIRSASERISRTRGSNYEDFEPFNHFIDRNALIDLPLGGRSFTWYRGDGLSMSRLDRFLLSDFWLLSFPNCSQLALPRSLSDHCPILLCIDVQDWGPKPLRMLKCWADIPGYGDFVKEKWPSFQIHGWSGYILKTKLKLIKSELRGWHLSHTANLDCRIQCAKSRLEMLDSLSERRGLDGVEETELLTLPAEILALSKLQASPLSVDGRMVESVPEVDSPQKVSDFRPIALASSIYKILSKVLANRLHSIIGNVVSEAQSAFIKGRQILDGILIANEVVDDAKRIGKDLLLFKVDFEKAYDSVDWSYLNEVMSKMNFPNLWRSWIMECITTASASVLVNGCPTDEFRFTPYTVGAQNSVAISHLQFADDTLLVGVKSWANVRALRAVLILFERISGLKVNFHKSLPIGGNPRRIQFWLPLIEKIRKRLSGWKCKNLSIGGRLILLKSVLSSIPVYFLSFFKAPSGRGWKVYLFLVGSLVGGGVSGWERNGEGWKWRRRLHAWEEELVRQCVGVLSNIVLQDGVSDRLPTKDNLLKRGVLEDNQTLCSANCDKMEDINHLFFQCNVYGKLWQLVSKWIGGEFVCHGFLREHAVQFRDLGGDSKGSRVLSTIIWISVLCVIWKDRNVKIFQSVLVEVETLLEKVKLQTYWWLKSYYKLFDVDYSLWGLNPLCCIQAIV
ncbi:hypothetical protein TSUD_26930 [Trifolium subterraneum]|uniref:Reverse transcriptase domain-containing protein n=1 Tax=Trifolium subterraneum TaxID=3900 RepID=A0A2Z6MKH8_TRISU|nr:hypothetical protein TSUD_26930 [Trifolium subterraneum]